MADSDDEKLTKEQREAKEKAEKEKALREGRTIPESAPVATSSPAAVAAATSGLAGKDYPQTRLQIRLASGGQPYTTTLSSDASTYLHSLSISHSRDAVICATEP